MEKKEFKEPELIEAQAKLKLGDTIKCSNADEMIQNWQKKIFKWILYMRGMEKRPLATHNICKARRQQA